MLVLSRQVDETLMIGDSILVTVVSIDQEMATLFVRYRDGLQRLEQKLALEVDDRLEITNDIHVYVVDIRDDKVRLGVVAPKMLAVHRKEVYESIKREIVEQAKRPAGGDTLLKPGVVLHLGDHLRLSLSPADKPFTHLASSGELVGGPRDGEPFARCEAISVGSVFDFGTLVRVCVTALTPAGVGLKIDHPMHMICRIES